MPKKRFDDRPYDPISADLVRDAMAGSWRPTSRTMSISIVPPQSKTAVKSDGSITKRFVLSRGEDAELNAFLLRLQQAAGTKIPLGLIVRAMLSVVMEAEADVCAVAARQTFRLPSTHDSLALGEFEDKWRECLKCALSTR